MKKTSNFATARKGGFPYLKLEFRHIRCVAEREIQQIQNPKSKTSSFKPSFLCCKRVTVTIPVSRL